MKHWIIAASLSAFVAAPLLACDMEGKGAKDHASLSTEKSPLKVAKTKVKNTKTLASTDSKKAKI